MTTLLTYLDTVPLQKPPIQIPHPTLPRALTHLHLPSSSPPSPFLQNPLRMYHDNIVEHYENPRNVGSLDKKKDTVGTGLVGAPACGDVMKLQIEVDDEGVIRETKFKTFGCGSAIASSSVATEWIKGKTVEEVRGYGRSCVCGQPKGRVGQ